MKEKRNRNAIRSKKLIRQAFLELLHEKPFEKITVTNLVERANLNRSTFYAHYPDMLGIIEEIEQETVAYIDNQLSNLDVDDFFKNPKYHLTYMFQLLEENKGKIKLDDDQTAAVRYDGDNHLVINAGPGSGKTRVIIERVVYLINIKFKLN